MCVVVAHAPGVNVDALRRVVLGTGLDCEGKDCVPWQDLAVRLARGDADLVIVSTSGSPDFDWDDLQDAIALTAAPVLAVGSPDDVASQQARSIGVIAYLDDRNLPHELDTAIQRLIKAGVFHKNRGGVLSVFAPAPGTGCSTIAVNLAGALAQEFPNEIALIELTRQAGEVALLLGATPEHTVHDVCCRWEGLDRLSLENSFHAHSTGIRLLVSGDTVADESSLNANAIRRIGVLTRIINHYTVLALDSVVGEVEIEAMRLSDSVLLVVRPDVPCLRLVQRAIRRAVSEGVPKDRFRIAVNRWGQGGQLRLKQVSSTLGMDIEYVIPDDPTRVNRATNEGKLLRDVAGFSKISRKFSSLAKSFNGFSHSNRRK